MLRQYPDMARLKRCRRYLDHRRSELDRQYLISLIGSTLNIHLWLASQFALKGPHCQEHHRSHCTNDGRNQYAYR